MRLMRLFIVGLYMSLAACGGGSSGGSGTSSGGGSSSYGGSSSGGMMVPLEPTLASIQANIFTPICTACHTGAMPPEGLNLEEGNSFAMLVGVPSNQVGTLMRVNPGNPDQSYIVQKIEGTAAGGVRMPANGPPYLSDAQIAAIRQWIADGALEMTMSMSMNNIASVAASSPMHRSTMSTQPSSITVAFDQALDASLVTRQRVSLQAAGGDNSFDEGNEADIGLASVVLSSVNPRLIVITLHEGGLADDQYRLSVHAADGVPLLGIAGLAIDGDGDGVPGGDYITEFSIASNNIGK